MLMFEKPGGTRKNCHDPCGLSSDHVDNLVSHSNLAFTEHVTTPQSRAVTVVTPQPATSSLSLHES